MNETLEITLELQAQITSLEEKVNDLTMRLEAVIHATFGNFSKVEDYLKKGEVESK